MKVALISSFFEPEAHGGAGALVHFLARGLSERGVEVVVITTHAKYGIEVERSGNIYIYRFRPANLYWIGNKDIQPVWKKIPWQLMDIWNPHTFWTVRRILERERPDIVHVHKLRNLSPSVWAAARAADVGSLIQTCHDYELMSPEGTLTGLIGSWAREGTWPLSSYQWTRSMLSRAVTAATAPSRYTLEMLTRRGLFAQAYTRVVPNSHGLVLEQLKRRREEMRGRKPPGDSTIRLLYLGRLEATKGVDLLCAAFECCAARCPNLRLDIAGWGTLELILQQRYGQHPQVTFHGPVFGKDKARLLARSDILVVPSAWPEVFGIVIVEAYTYGKPVIAARIGGIPEIVDDGVTGFLAPSEDLDAFIEALCCVAKDPLSVCRMAPACFDAAQRYALEPVTEGYLAVYEAVRTG